MKINSELNKVIRGKQGENAAAAALSKKAIVVEISPLLSLCSSPSLFPLPFPFIRYPCSVLNHFFPCSFRFPFLPFPFLLSLSFFFCFF